MSGILFVYARGGAPMEYALPRVAACGDTHVLAVAPLPARHQDWLAHCASVSECAGDTPRGLALVELIVERAKEVGADAVVCMSEYVVLAVAVAAQRLGLAGPGPGIWASRNKRLMRQTWHRAGVPQPRFRPVSSPDEVRSALAELGSPLLLKPAWGAGSVGQAILREESEAAGAWERLGNALQRGVEPGFTELYATAQARELLVEEIVTGSAQAWYNRPGHADYVAVEGIVADGVYHPVSITGKTPTLPPFAETSALTPSGLPEPAQRVVEQAARRAVDALELGTCATHTELKLCGDGSAVAIESAARVGGWMIARQVELVLGIDLIGSLVRQLLGEPVRYPERLLVDGRGAAASVPLVATDSTGVPWRGTVVWDSQRLDPARLVSPASTLELVPGLTVPDGTPMPPYDPAAGAGNFAGMFFLTAPDVDVLLADCRSVLDGMEAVISEGGDS
jgi:biotin carboxylase